MSFAESGPEQVADATRSESADPTRGGHHPVIETTELRWFVPEPLPEDIRRWFTGSTGAAEDRYDTYLLSGRGDVGVKRRFGETLELKVRQRLDGPIELGEGLAGTLEVWRKWSPAEGLVEHGTDAQWVDVHKSIVKRRFSMDGTEIAFSPGPEVADAGCDVEVAGVDVGDIRGWTFAFAAFGPPPTRRGALVASWQCLAADPARPELFGSGAGRAMGYPEWLALTISPDAEEQEEDGVRGPAGPRSGPVEIDLTEGSPLVSRPRKGDKAATSKQTHLLIDEGRLS